VQGTGERTPFDRARLDELLDLAAEGAGRLVEIQRRVLAEDLEVFSER
jgi:ribonuclease PH